MDVREETKKRLRIAEEIVSQLRGIVKGIMLGGSMGFGQNYSITEKSDLDIVVVIDLEKLDELESCEYFKGQIPKEVLTAFKSKEINFFWITKEVNGIEVNTFIYEMQGYLNFCLLKGNLVGYIKNKPATTQDSYGFNGDLLQFNRNIRVFNQGFIYEKPALVGGKFWGGVPRQDFFYSGQKLYEENSFFTSFEKQVWRKAVEQLVKEYGGNPDLNKTNILNTHFTYQEAKEKLPQEIIEKIQERTKEELMRISNSKKNGPGGI